MASVVLAIYGRCVEDSNWEAQPPETLRRPSQKAANCPERLQTESVAAVGSGVKLADFRCLRRTPLALEFDAFISAKHVAGALPRDPLQRVGLVLVDEKPAEIELPMILGGAQQKLLPLAVPLPRSPQR